MMSPRMPLAVVSARGCGLVVVLVTLLLWMSRFRRVILRPVLSVLPVFLSLIVLLVTLLTFGRRRSHAASRGVLTLVLGLRDVRRRGRVIVMLLAVGSRCRHRWRCSSGWRGPTAGTIAIVALRARVICVALLVVLAPPLLKPVGVLYRPAQGLGGVPPVVQALLEPLQDGHVRLDPLQHVRSHLLLLRPTSEALGDLPGMIEMIGIGVQALVHAGASVLRCRPLGVGQPPIGQLQPEL